MKSSTAVFLYSNERGRGKVKPFLLETVDPQIPQKKHRRVNATIFFRIPNSAFEQGFLLTIRSPTHIIKIR
jgi:hypothetical protein